MIELLRGVGGLVRAWWGPSIDELAFQRLDEHSMRQYSVGQRAFNWLEQTGGGFTPAQRRQQTIRRRRWYEEHGWLPRPSAEPLIETTGGPCQGQFCGDPTCQLFVHV